MDANMHRFGQLQNNLAEELVAEMRFSGAHLAQAREESARQPGPGSLV